MPIEVHSATSEESRREYHEGAQSVRRSFRTASAVAAALGLMAIFKGLSILPEDQPMIGYWTIYMGACALVFSLGNWLQFAPTFRSRSFTAGVYLHGAGFGGLCVGTIFWLLL